MAYEFVEDELSQETSPESALRHVTRTASNIGTRAAGIPGDILSLAQKYITAPITRKLTGSSNELPYEESTLGKILPTTEMHRKGIENVLGGYVKPQNEVEKFADDVIEDAALLLSPGKLANSAKKIQNGVKQLYKSIGANVLGKTVEGISNSTEAGNYTKSGALLTLALFDKDAAAKQIGKMYQQAEALLPEGAKIDAVKLEKNIASLEHKITRGRPISNLSAPEKFVIDQTDKVKELIKDGDVSIEQLLAQKRSLNQELSSLFKDFPTKGEQKTIKNMAKQVNGYLNEAIEKYGKTNPEFYKLQKDADQAFGTIAQSNFIGNWVSKLPITKSFATHGLSEVFGSTLATKVAAAALPYQATKLIYRMRKSPVLREIYTKSLKAAAEENTVAFTKYAKQLDEALQKEESQDEYEFID